MDIFEFLADVAPNLSVWDRGYGVAEFLTTSFGGGVQCWLSDDINGVTGIGFDMFVYVDDEPIEFYGVDWEPLGDFQFFVENLCKIDHKLDKLT